MIKLIDLLNEAPIGTYTTIGDFEKGASYKDPRDRASVSHPVTVQKVKDMLKNINQLVLNSLLMQCCKDIKYKVMVKILV